MPAKPDNILRMIEANEMFTNKMAAAIKESYSAFHGVVDHAQAEDFNQQGAQHPLVDGSLKAWIRLLDGSVEAWFEAMNKFLHS